MMHQVVSDRQRHHQQSQRHCISQPSPNRERSAASSGEPFQVSQPQPKNPSKCAAIPQEMINAKVAMPNRAGWAFQKNKLLHQPSVFMGQRIQEKVRPGPKNDRHRENRHRTRWPLAQRQELLPITIGKSRDHRCAESVKEPETDESNWQAKADAPKDLVGKLTQAPFSKSVTGIGAQAADDQTRKTEEPRTI